MSLIPQLQGASNFSFGCRYNGAGLANPSTGTAADQTVDRCTSEKFSNDVTARLETLGGYGANPDDAAFLAQTSPSGEKDMFRGGGSNAATLAAIKSGKLDISDLNADGSTTEKDTIIKFSVNYHLTDDIMLYGVYSEGYRPATQNRNAGSFVMQISLVSMKVT